MNIVKFDVMRLPKMRRGLRAKILNAHARWSTSTDPRAPAMIERLRDLWFRLQLSEAVRFGETYGNNGRRT